jgi:hypothetical protein
MENIPGIWIVGVIFIIALIAYFIYAGAAIFLFEKKKWW